MAEHITPRWSGTLADYFLTRNILTRDEVQKEDDLFCKEVVNALASDKNSNILTLSNIKGVEENRDNNECCIELVNEWWRDDGKFKNSELEAFVKVKKGEVNGIVGERPNVPTTQVGTINIGNKTLNKIQKEGESNTYIAFDSFTDHNFPLEGFNQKEDDGIRNKWYLRPIFVKDLDELKRKSANIYLYGFKLILTGKDNTKFYDVVPKANSVRYFDLCFVELSSEGKALNFYRIRVKINDYNKQYFLPTIAYWEGNEQTVFVETAYDEKLDETKDVKPSKKSTIKNVYFRTTPSTLEYFKIENIRSRVIGIASNTKPERVVRNVTWASRINGNRMVCLLENNDLFEYTLNIKLKEGGSKVLNLIDLEGIKSKLFYPGDKLIRFKGEQEGEPLEFELKNEGDTVGELYRFEIKASNPEDTRLILKDEKIFIGDTELVTKSKQVDNGGDWNDAGLSSYGKIILQNHGCYKFYFYTDENGYAKYGYDHGFDNSLVNDKDVWDRFKEGMTKEGYVLKEKMYVTLNGTPVKNKTFDFLGVVENKRISEALNSDLLDITSCKLIEQCFEKLVSNDLPRNGRETKTYMYADCLNKKEKNDILKNLKQSQWDALIVCLREGNENFIKGIANKNPKTYEEFCKVVYSTAGSIKTKKEELAESWQQEVKNLFITDRIRQEEEGETGGREQEISSIEIIAKTVRECEILSVMDKEAAKRIISLYTPTQQQVQAQATAAARTNQQKSDFNSYHYVYCIRPITEDSEIEEQSTEISKNEINWLKEKDFINRWTARLSGKDNTIKKQFLINTNRYYDFYSGMTPYVEVWFRGELKDDANKRNGVDRYEWHIINSIEHPYIKSLSVEDKGVKQVSLSLFDKDFASYQNGILGAFDEGARKNKIYSLEDLIRQSLVTEMTKEDRSQKPEAYEFIREKEDLRSDFLKFNDAQTKLTPANLRIRFGYCDANPKVATGNDERVKKYFQSKGINTNATNGRTNRWWNVKQENLETCKTVEIKVVVDSSTRKVDGGKTILQNEPAMQKANDNEANVSQSTRETSDDVTTAISYLKDYMIVGYSSTLKSNGIEYNLKGIEVCHAEIMRKRFLQRYTEIVSNPIEVLYILMRMFNEAHTGTENPTGVKLVYYNDKKDIPSVDTINMMLDFSSLSEEEKTNFADVDDYYTARTNKKISINPKMLKSISISLGGEEAIRNYSRNLERPLYKNVEALINEFCAACPSRREKLDDDTKAYDDNGNEIKNDTYTSNEVLSWFIAQPVDGDGKNDKNIYIVLYYRKARPVKNIRLYQWGPELAGKTVVKNISIQNKNEFAILSGVNSIQPKNGKLIRNIKYNLNNSGRIYADAPVDVKDKKNGANGEIKEDFESGNVITTGYVNDNEFDGNRYNAAFDNCMYVGKMDILGDPSLEFNLLRQPYTYPIRLEVIVPRNEGYFRNRKIRDQENKGEFGHRPTYKDSNQRLHEMTGYYVITKINHNISSSGYTTSLELSSYPRIENDILIKEGKNIKPPELKE